MNTSTKKVQMDYVLVRTKTAGVFAGYLESKRDTAHDLEVVLKDVRRIWYWKGAASLSQLAVEGTSAPNECKFPCTVPKITLSEVIEILEMTAKAKKSIEDVPIWKA